MNYEIPYNIELIGHLISRERADVYRAWHAIYYYAKRRMFPDSLNDRKIAVSFRDFRNISNSFNLKHLETLLDNYFEPNSWTVSSRQIGEKKVPADIYEIEIPPTIGKTISIPCEFIEYGWDRKTEFQSSINKMLFVLLLDVTSSGKQPFRFHENDKKVKDMRDILRKFFPNQKKTNPIRLSKCFKEVGILKRKKNTIIFDLDSYTQKTCIRKIECTVDKDLQQKGKKMIRRLGLKAKLQSLNIARYAMLALFLEEIEKRGLIEETEYTKLYGLIKAARLIDKADDHREKGELIKGTEYKRLFELIEADRLIDEADVPREKGAATSLYEGIQDFLKPKGVVLFPFKIELSREKAYIVKIVPLFKGFHGSALLFSRLNRAYENKADFQTDFQLKARIGLTSLGENHCPVIHSVKIKPEELQITNSLLDPRDVVLDKSADKLIIEYGMTNYEILKIENWLLLIP